MKGQNFANIGMLISWQMILLFTMVFLFILLTQWGAEALARCNSNRFNKQGKEYTDSLNLIPTDPAGEKY